MTSSTLPLMLNGLVPIALMTLAFQGGPTSSDVESAKALVDEVIAHADVLLYPREANAKERGRHGGMLGRLAKAVAVMAYQPGGVDLFGQHWEVS